MFATLFYDMLAGFGCMSMTVLLVLVAAAAAAVRTGHAPRLAEWFDQLLNGAGKEGETHPAPIVYRDTDPQPVVPPVKKKQYPPPPDLE